MLGLTKTSNRETTVDWVSVLTTVGGLVISAGGCMR